MKSSDRPPLASDLSCDHDRNNAEEDFRRQMDRPLLPSWNGCSDEPCQCDAIAILYDEYKEPYGPVWHLRKCPLCCKVWKYISRTESDYTDNPAEN